MCQVSRRMNGWVEKVRVLNPYFSRAFREKDINVLVVTATYDDGSIYRYTPLGYALNFSGPPICDRVMRVLLEASADPNIICMMIDTSSQKRIVSYPLELAHNEESARILIEAGSAVKYFQRFFEEECTHGSYLVYNFYEASRRATSVVWCCDVLRATSSWPDMAFLLTRIMMDVSK